jgi:hypothetical protein
MHGEAPLFDDGLAIIEQSQGFTCSFQQLFPVPIESQVEHQRFSNLAQKAIKRTNR